jgi:protein-tyrosine phosphatase
MNHDAAARTNRRTLIVGTTACLMSAADASARMFSQFEASTWRIDEDTVRLSWSGASAPLTIRSSVAPDQSERDMPVIAQPSVDEQHCAVEACVSPRSYFLLRSPSGATRTAERVLVFEGAHNFRDLGGYRGALGRQLRWGSIYRAASMHNFSAVDQDFISQLNIGIVIDLRSSTERAHAPAPFSAASGVEVVSFDYDIPPLLLHSVLATRSRAEAIQATAEMYIHLAEMLAPQLRILLHALRTNVPLAFNCTAGKDRTGVIAALVLSVLGVGRSEIIMDYALSETLVPAQTYLDRINDAGLPGTLTEEQRNLFRGIPLDVATVVLGTPPEAMQSFLHLLDVRSGGPTAFVRQLCGMSQDEIVSLHQASLYHDNP